VILTKEDIVELQKKFHIIEGAVDFERQLTPQGVDLTVKEIHEFVERGCIDFDNSSRRIPETKKIEWEEDTIFLKPGIYKLVTNEIFNLPTNLAAISQSRSSLLRMGAFVSTGVWDAGFSGRAEFVLVVMNPKGIEIKKNARVAQLIFIKLTGDTEPYRGIFHGQK